MAECSRPHILKLEAQLAEYESASQDGEGWMRKWGCANFYLTHSSGLQSVV